MFLGKADHLQERGGCLREADAARVDAKRRVAMLAMSGPVNRGQKSALHRSIANPRQHDARVQCSAPLRTSLPGARNESLKPPKAGEAPGSA